MLPSNDSQGSLIEADASATTIHKLSLSTKSRFIQNELQQTQASDVLENNVVVGLDRLELQLDRTLEPARQQLLRVADQEVDRLGLKFNQVRSTSEQQLPNGKLS